MAYQEKRSWIMLVVSAVGYAIYLALVCAGAPYKPTLLWTIGGAIVVSIVLSIVAGILGGPSGSATDQRDEQIGRFGEHIGQSFVVIGGVAALLLAMMEVDTFWIANAVYLAFVLSALTSSVAKIFAYRKGFHPW